MTSLLFSKSSLLEHFIFIRGLQAKVSKFVQCTYADVFYWGFLGQRFQQRVQTYPDLRRIRRGKMPHDITNVTYEYNSAYVKRVCRIVRLLDVVLYGRGVQQLD